VNGKRGQRPDPRQADPEIAKVVGALRGPATPEELRDEARYLEVFDAVGPAPGRVVELADADRRRPLRTVRISSKVAAAVAAILVAGVGAAAAYTGNLPRGLQSSAHHLLGVQAPPRTTPSTGPATTGPGAGATSTTPGPSATPGRSLSLTAGASSATPTGPAGSTASLRPTPADVAGLCSAWSKGGLATTSTSYRRLALAAGGSAHVASYCAGVLASTPTGSSSATTHGRSPRATKAGTKAGLKSSGVKRAKVKKAKNPKRPRTGTQDAATDRPV
jgi:hypothetical protein